MEVEESTSQVQCYGWQVGIPGFQDYALKCRQIT